MAATGSPAQRHQRRCHAHRAHRDGRSPEPLAALADAVVEGGSRAAAIETAIAAADQAAGRGHWVPGGQIGSCIAWVTRHLARVAPADWADELDAVVGTSVAAQESVPAAFGILAVASSACDAVCLAASAATPMPPGRSKAAAGA
jgi:ADP-ribosylglycohydrolase